MTAISHTRSARAAAAIAAPPPAIAIRCLRVAARLQAAAIMALAWRCSCSIRRVMAYDRRGGSLVRTGDAETVEIVAAVGFHPAARREAIDARLEEPRCAAQHMLGAVAGLPGAAVSGRAVVTLVQAVGDPFPGV